MKKVLILCFSFFLWACGGGPEVRIEAKIQPRIPFHILLSDSAGTKVGMAVPIQDSIFVTSDYLLQKYDKLFWQENEVDIVARDFDDNLLFFQLERWTRGEARWSDSPPVIGDEIFWVAGKTLSEQTVHSVANISKDQIRQDVIVVSGNADIVHSGSPMFNRDGKVFGILIGGDRAEGQSYAVRSDKILQILAEHLEE